jgi:hypothetical protein
MRRVLPFCLFALGILLAPAAWSLSEVEFEGALVWIGNADPAGAPSPLLPALGVSFPLVERRLWGVEAGALLTGTYYEYVNGRAVPSELEHRDFAVAVILADVRAGLHLPLGRSVVLSLTGGLIFYLPLPIPLFPDAWSKLGPTMSYMLLRSLYPETEISVRFPLLPSLDLRLGARAGWPILHMIDGEGLPFWDQMIVSGVLGVVYRLPVKGDQTKS